ncbi:MAG: DUF4129 domain-containing protein [Rhabdochlamydiaceae bacterium]
MGKNTWRFSLAVALSLLLIVVATVPRGVFAADDSNSGQLAQSQTLNSQQLSSTLGNLTQGLNNTQVNQLVNQFQSQLNSGNNAGASSTLQQLQSTLQTQSGSKGVPDSLNALLQSLSAGPNGFSINPGLLSGLLGLDSPNGLPSNMSNMSPQSASASLEALSYLLQKVNPTLAQQLLSSASAIEQSLGANPSLPHPGSLPTGHLSTPGIKPPTLSSPTTLNKLPSINATTLAFPAIFIAAAIAIFLSRYKLASAIGRQITPGESKPLDMTTMKYDPSDPRSRILYAFHKAVGAMRRKGFEKYIFESHREFAAKCRPSAEAPHVSIISTLYEKAKFSGRQVSTSEADQASQELSAVEQ